MNFMNSVVNFFKDGGLFLYPLALIFVVGISIAIERYVYLTRETFRNRSLWDDLVPALSAGNFKQVVSLTQNSKASIATILNYGVARVASARRRDDIEKAMDESLLEVIPRIEKRTHYLSSLANVGLLIGLLGTITGLIGAFSAVATANPAEKASLLAAAISVAMNNTASGLAVAITLLLSPDAFDFSKPVVVTAGGRNVLEGQVSKSLATLMAWAARDNDRTMLFGAELKVTLAP